MRVEFVAETNGRRYSLDIAVPMLRPASGGFPVLYVLDGYWYFGSAAEVVRACAPEVVVVGVGYPDDQEYIDSVLERHPSRPSWIEEEPPYTMAVSYERMYDLSLRANDETLTATVLPGFAVRGTDVGGVDDFLKMIEQEVKPRVAALAAIDPMNQAIFGYSLAGLAVLHALFVEPNAFRTFVVASPSIWWNNGAVLSGEAAFAKEVVAGAASPRVLVTMGGEEGTADPNIAARLGVDFGEFTALLQKHRMVENARELVHRLKSLPGSGQFHVEEYALFPKEDHGISAWSALGRGIAYAFPR